MVFLGLAPRPTGRREVWGEGDCHRPRLLPLIVVCSCHLLVRSHGWHSHKYVTLTGCNCYFMLLLSRCLVGVCAAVSVCGSTATNDRLHVLINPQGAVARGGVG